MKLLTRILKEREAKDLDDNYLPNKGRSMMELFIESKTYGRFVVVYSAADDDIVQEHNWCITKIDNNFYAMTHTRDTEGKRKIKYLHSMIMGTYGGFHTDHINGNTLDNRRENLRVCSHAENSHNRCKPKSITSGFKGVTWHKHAKSWMAYITHEGKKRYLGYYKIKEEAARVRDKALWQLRPVITPQMFNFPEEYFK